jgi:nicotinamidase-related amidase
MVPAAWMTRQERALLELPSLTMVDGPLPFPRLVVGRVALLVVDMQHYAAHPDHGLGRRVRERGLADHFEYYFAAVERIVPVIADLVAVARAAGIEVAHLISEGRTVDGRDLSHEYKRRNVFTPRGAPAGAVLPELAPAADDLVFRKVVAGGFAGTAMDTTFRAMSIDTLIVAGVATNQCVESTVRAASHLGYDVVVVEDGCATYSHEWQQFSLESMADQFASVRSAVEIAGEIERLAA